MQAIHIQPAGAMPELEALRADVRAYFLKARGQTSPTDRAKNWLGGDKSLARDLGQNGWLGMAWPKEYGGQERSNHERYVVWEESLAAGAQICSCMPMDRQTGPLLLEHASERVKTELLPRMVRGEISICVGMSEPDAGSDLASVRSTARRTDDGWVLNGRKIWTSMAHEADYMIGLFRSGSSTSRHEGLSQFIIDMRTPGLTVRPIPHMQGETHFNECTFDEVRLPPYGLIGREGEGWKQVTQELGYERSGPERFLSAFELLRQMIGAADKSNPHHTAQLGQLVAELIALREMSLGISAMLERGESPALAASIVKDRGTTFEQKVAETAHELFDIDLSDPQSELAEVASFTTQAAPQFSIRGGAREILRGIIAKGVGL